MKCVRGINSFWKLLFGSSSASRDSFSLQWPSDINATEDPILRVLKIHKILPEGVYQGIVVDIDVPKQMVGEQSRRYFRCAVHLDIGGRTMFTYLVGTLSTMVMIYRARRHWIDRQVTVNVGINKYRNQAYNSAQVIWPFEVWEDEEKYQRDSYSFSDLWATYTDHSK